MFLPEVHGRLLSGMNLSQEAIWKVSNTPCFSQPLPQSLLGKLSLSGSVPRPPLTPSSEMNDSIWSFLNRYDPEIALLETASSWEFVARGLGLILQPALPLPAAKSWASSLKLWELQSLLCMAGTKQAAHPSQLAISPAKLQFLISEPEINPAALPGLHFPSCIGLNLR